MNNMTLIVLKKELKDVFRDKKTLFMTIFFPIVLMLGVFGLTFFMGNNQMKEVAENYTIKVDDKGNSKFAEFIKGQSGVKLVETDSYEDALEAGTMKIGVEIPENFDKEIAEGKTSTLKVFYDNVSDKGMDAVTRLQSMVDMYKEGIVTARLQDKGLGAEILQPINIEKIGVNKDEDKAMAAQMMGMLLPYLILAFSAVGVINVTSDIGAGEKERGTLEPLLTTKAGRGAIVFGKLLAATTIGMITSVSIIVSILGAMFVLPVIMDVNVEIPITVTQVLLVGLLTMALSIFYAGVFLSISFISKNYKESQTFASFGQIAVMIPAMILMFSNIRGVGTGELLIPIYNVGLLIKMLFMNVATMQSMLIVTGSSLLYTVIVVILTKFLLSREEVIFRG